MNENQKNLINHGLKFGFILGTIFVIIQLFSYLVNKEWLSSFWIGLVNIALMITIPCVGLAQYRKQQGGLLPFNNAFVVAFLILVGSSLITSTFQYLLYSYIDPDLSAFVKEKAIEGAASMTEKFGGTQEDVETAVRRIEETDFTQTPSKVAGAFAVSILINAVLALILGAIFKKSPKLEGLE